MGDGKLLAQGCQLQQVANVEGWLSDFAEDAKLYLGPATSLTTTQESPDIYLDLKFRAEIDRRTFLLTHNHLEPATAPQVSPHYLHAPSGNKDGTMK